MPCLATLVSAILASLLAEDEHATAVLAEPVRFEF